MLKFKAAIRRAAVFVDRWHWLLLLIASPFLLFPTPTRTAALVIVPGLWIVAWLAGNDPIPSTPLNGVLLLISLMMLVSLFATYDVVVSLPKITGLVLGIVVFVAIVRSSRLKRNWCLILFVFLALSVGMASIGLLGTQWISKVGLLSVLTSHLPPILTGLPGAEEGLQPNQVAGSLLWVIPELFILSAMIVRRTWRPAAISKRGRKLIGAALIISATLFVTGTMILTQSRSGYIALAVGGLTLMIVALPTRYRRFIIGGLVVVALIIGLAVARYSLDTILHSVFGSGSDNPVLSLDTLEGRVEVWSRALNGIQDFPFTGMGMNTFRHIVPVFYPLSFISSDFDIAHAHNEFLQAALDLGLPGLIAFCALYVGAFWMVREIWRTASDSTVRYLGLGLGGGLFAHLLYGLTDAVALGSKPGILFWCLLGLITGLFQQQQLNSHGIDQATLAEKKRKSAYSI